MNFMLEHYFDDPQKIEDWIEGLTAAELDIFEKGWGTAIAGVLEHISESKTRILANYMDHLDDDEAIMQLSSRIHLLDIYEKHYKKRFNTLIEA